MPSVHSLPALLQPGTLTNDCALYKVVGDVPMLMRLERQLQVLSRTDIADRIAAERSWREGAALASSTGHMFTLTVYSTSRISNVAL